MPISPELLKIMKERIRGTLIELIGFIPIDVSKERVVAELPFRDDLTQPTGLLHAGAILTLADTAATILANQHTMSEPGKFDPSRFATTIQLNAHFVRNSKTNKIVAEAVPVHVGKRTLVVQVTVRDEDGNLFATVTTTMITASAG
jgi:1,4-dihydroxy-2-naphthoyl-CoA hydrolase